jgi:hypothetical protein
VLYNGNTDLVSGNIHISSYITHEHLYKLFVEEVSPTAASLPSPSSFATYLKIHYTHVHFSKHTRLGCCCFCTDLVERRKQLHTPQEVADLTKASNQHHKLHTTERTLYESRKAQTAAEPDKFLSIIVDCLKGCLFNLICYIINFTHCHIKDLKQKISEQVQS